MSIRLMTQVWDLDLGATETLVMLCLADFASDDGGNCWPSIATIAKRARCSERHAIRVLGALERDGWITVRRVEGRVNHYTVRVTPDTMSPLTSCHGTPDTHVTGPLTPMSPDPSTNHQGTTTTPLPPATSAPDRFDEFWSTYPRREAKQAARRAWDKVVASGVEAQAVIDGAARYRDDPSRTPRYTAHPATWLNAGRWEDEALPASAAGGMTGNEAVAQMQALARRLEAADAAPQIGG